MALPSETADGSFGDHERTDFIKDPIVLETNVSDDDVNLSDLLQAWDVLHPVSVEVALAGQPDIFSFANEHCLFFAVVLWNHLVPLPNPFAPPDVTPTNETEEDESEPAMERVWDTVGVVYIATSALPREVHVGIAVRPPFRGKGLGRRACELALDWALETLQMHRVQARIPESPCKYRTRALFAALGFAHEGMQRRAVMNTAGEWADVVQMGVLDTDWTMRAQRRGPRSSSLWDELLQRYQSEVDELLRSDDGRKRVRTTNSTETLRDAGGPNGWDRGRQSEPPSFFGSYHFELVRPTDVHSKSEAGGSDMTLDSEWERLTSGSAGRSAPSQSSSFSSGELVPRPPSTVTSGGSSYCSAGSFQDAPSEEDVIDDEQMGLF